MPIDRREPEQFAIDLAFELATQLSLREIELKATRADLLEAENREARWHLRYLNVSHALAFCAVYASLVTLLIFWFLFRKG